MKKLITLAVFLFAAIISKAGEAEDRAYRESQEAYQKSVVASEKANAAYEKERHVVAITGGILVVGLLIFAVVPMYRLQKTHAARSIELAVQTKAIIEDIREILRKKA